MFYRLLLAIMLQKIDRKMDRKFVIDPDRKLDNFVDIQIDRQ